MLLRRKVMLVLLVAAVLPMLAVRAVQAVLIYRLQQAVSQQTRVQLNDQAQADMQRAVQGYARSLEQVRRLGLSLLKNQASEIDARLVGPRPDEPLSIPSVQAFASYERSDDTPFTIVPSMRHAVVTDAGELEPLNVSYDTQVYLSFEEQVSNESVEQFERLAGMSFVYRAINNQVDETILWQYTTLESGMHFSYPGKSLFPQGYNPKQQAWYRRALQVQQAVTSQPYIDAATGQLVITFAQPVYGPG